MSRLSTASGSLLRVSRQLIWPPQIVIPGPSNVAEKNLLLGTDTAVGLVHYQIVCSGSARLSYVTVVPGSTSLAEPGTKQVGGSRSI